MKEWQTKQEELGNYILQTGTRAPIAGIRKAFGYGLVTHAGYIDLNRFLEDARNFFRKKGLFIDAILDYSDFEIQGNRLHYTKQDAETIIFCEGAHIAGNPFFSFVKMKPAKGEIMLIEAPGLPGDFIINKDLFVLPLQDHQFKIGSTYEWDELSEQPTAKGKQSIIERFEKLVTVEYTVLGHWAGIRPGIRDRRPALGFHPQFGNAAVFNGLGAKGVMLAPYFARDMARLLNNRQYPLNREVRLERFLNK